MLIARNFPVTGGVVSTHREMPVYEEKLISPLAVHYTQDHIRTTFRDTRLVEDAVAQITSEPGSGDYDIILRAPFPSIEILRWHDGEDKHWFTLDNRRLYCLQKAALAYWPKRVGAVVEILYSARGSFLRKYDTTTGGFSVSIAHHCKDAPLSRWDWREQVPLGLADRACTDAVLADDLKDHVDDLAEAASSADPLARLSVFLEAGSMPPPKEGARSNSGAGTPSTEAAASDSSDAASDGGSPWIRPAPEPRPVPPPALVRAALVDPRRAAAQRVLGGVEWAGGMSETYKIKFNNSPTAWTVIREDANGRKPYPLTYDEERGLVYWGSSKAYALDVAQLSESPRELRWFEVEAFPLGPPPPQGARRAAGRPRFRWRRIDEHVLTDGAGEPNYFSQPGAAHEKAHRGTGGAKWHGEGVMLGPRSWQNAYGAGRRR